MIVTTSIIKSLVMEYKPVTLVVLKHKLYIIPRENFILGPKMRINFSKGPKQSEISLQDLGP